MNITGAENLLFGVDDLATCKRFLSIFGLQEVESSETGAAYRALDGSGIDMRLMDDPSLPPVKATGPTLRVATWGVGSQADLDAIAEELGKDREVRWIDGVLQSEDDDGNHIHFRITQRTPFKPRPPRHNSPGCPPVRFNERASFEDHGPAQVLGHVVYWSPDAKRAMAFYVDRLGFQVTDEFAGNFGIFARAPGHGDHHSIFFITNRDVPPGFQHTEFTVGDVQEVFVGGHKLTNAGFKTAVGPGRHESGSNWFWYFDTPFFGGNLELGADMDQVDSNWKPTVYTDLKAAGGWATGMIREFSRD